jgi:hypothetical protein
MSGTSCPGDSTTCEHHFHDEDTSYLTNEDQHTDLEAAMSGASTGPSITKKEQEAQPSQPAIDKHNVGFRRIIRNFTPSYVFNHRHAAERELTRS